MTPAMTRQLEIVRAAGSVRDAQSARTVKGLTTPVLYRLAKLGLVTISMEIAPFYNKHCYTVINGRKIASPMHATIFTAVDSE